MKKIILLALIVAVFVGCSKDDVETEKGNVQKSIDAISDKASAKSIIINGELLGDDWILLKQIRDQLPAVESITLNDVIVIKKDVFAYKDGIAWETNRWLKSFSAPKATTIEDAAFMFCESLLEFKAPKVEKIGAEAFRVCAITGFDFPIVKEIGSEAFIGCEKINSITLPELIELNDEVFYGCYSLTTVNLPKVTKINSRVFRSCDNLIELKLGATTGIEVSLLSFDLLTTKNITLDLAGAEANEAVGNIWKKLTWKSITNQGQSLPKPDFGIANFGSTMDFVLQYETKSTVSGGNSKRLIYANGSIWYIYNFDDNSKLISGEIDESVQFGGTPSDLIFTPIINYKNTLTKLAEKYGAADSFTEDVFSYNMTAKSMVAGNAFYEAQRIMNGGKTVTYRFSDDRCIVESILRFYTRSGQYQTWGYTIRTIYTKRN